MFNSIGNLKKNLYLQKTSASKDLQYPEKGFIKKLENTDLVEIETKIEILEIISGFRLMTEALPKTQKVEDINNLENFLVIGELEFHKNKYTRTKKRATKTITFFSIFSNEAVKKYFLMFERELEPSELGLLYGYHPKSILAFLGFIEQSGYGKFNHAYQFFNSKVMSKDFFEDEDRYHQDKWENIKKLSPRIVNDAEKYFKNYKEAT